MASVHNGGDGVASLPPPSFSIDICQEQRESVTWQLPWPGSQEDMSVASWVGLDLQVQLLVLEIPEGGQSQGCLPQWDGPKQGDQWTPELYLNP